METLLQLGNLHQIVVVSGYIPHELQLVVDSNGKYHMKFNIRSYDNDGFATLLPCVAYGQIAQNIYDQLTNRDTVVIFGQLKTKYDFRVQDTYTTIKVLSYSITVATSRYGRDGVLTDEKQEYIEWCLRLFDKTGAPPTEEQSIYWREYWKQYRKDFSKETVESLKELKPTKKPKKRGRKKNYDKSNN